MREKLLKIWRKPARMFKKAAFSLPEILITTGIVGATAVVVLGVANKEISTQTMNTQRTIINNEIAVAVADMQSEGRLAGYDTQEKFNNAFKKFYSIKSIADDEVSKNFANTYTNEDGTSFSANDYENKAVTPSGASFAYTYDTGCNPKHQFSQDSSKLQKVGNNYSFVAKNEALSCLTGFIDINGPKGPNKVGKDVLPLTKFEKDCRDKEGNITNFIPNAYGNCPNDEDKNKEDTLFPASSVCTLTELNCKANGSLKTLDRNSCECKCKLSCPKGQTLNEESCTCSCNKENIIKNICKKADGKTDNPYADCEASKNVCACIPKNPNAPKLCKENGGIWNPSTCSCSCPQSVKNDINEEYNNLAYPDDNDFCRPKCKFSQDNNDFKNIVVSNAIKKESVNQEQVKSITKASTSIEDKCFTCNSDLLSGNMQATKKDQRGQGGYCSVGCSEPDKSAYNEKYFEWLGYNADNLKNSCKWKCRDGNNEGVKKLANDLNSGKYNTSSINYTKPEINSVENFKIAQERYFTAAALGQVQTLYPNLPYGTPSNPAIVSGISYNTYYAYNCTAGCTDVYSKFKSGQSRFAGFLRYAESPDTAPSYAFGWPTSINEDSYKIKYSANTNSCTIEAEGIDYGQPPTPVLVFHCSGIYDRSSNLHNFCWADTYGFSYRKNGNRIPNPNNFIKKNNKSLPQEFVVKSQGRFDLDDNWRNLNVGVNVTVASAADPLALNIGSKTDDDPAVESARTAEFHLIYDKNQYIPISVHWPIESGYQFIVNKKFHDNSSARHVGNMFSDQKSWDGETYPTGFAQLRAQYDKNNDSIITRDELQDLYLWRRFKIDNKNSRNEVNEFISLKDIVLDINTNSTAATTASGDIVANDNIIYDIQGQYRKLVKLEPNETPICKAKDVCVKYIGYDRNNLNDELKLFIQKLEGTTQLLELWQDMNMYNTDVYYYYLRTKGGSPEIYNTTWNKIYKSKLQEIKIKTIPDDAEKVSDNNSIPEEFKDKISSNNQNETVKVYKDKNKDSNYYVVKETTFVDNSINIERIKYILPGYETQDGSYKVSEQYFKNGNQWYLVVVAKVTDIIFKYNRGNEK